MCITFAWTLFGVQKLCWLWIFKGYLHVIRDVLVFEWNDETIALLTSDSTRDGLSVIRFSSRVLSCRTRQSYRALPRLVPKVQLVFTSRGTVRAGELKNGTIAQNLKIYRVSGCACENLCMRAARLTVNRRLTQSVNPDYFKDSSQRTRHCSCIVGFALHRA